MYTNLHSSYLVTNCCWGMKQQWCVCEKLNPQLQQCHGDSCYVVYWIAIINKTLTIKVFVKPYVYRKKNSCVFILLILPIRVPLPGVISSQQQDLTLGMRRVKRSRILVIVSRWSSHLRSGIVGRGGRGGRGEARTRNTSSCRLDCQVTIGFVMCCW